VRPGRKDKHRGELRQRPIRAAIFGSKTATKYGLLALACALLTGCAAPHVDSRREAGQTAPVGPSTPDMVAICYGHAKAAQAQTLADSECAKTGRVAHFDHANAWSCTLVAPTRGFYRCIAKP
jgi:hypothetical protein